MICDGKHSLCGSLGSLSCLSLWAEAQWPFMKKAYSLPHFSSFGTGAGQDDGMNKMVTEPIKSSAFMPRSTADAFDREVQVRSCPCWIAIIFLPLVYTFQ